jgi:hypothetical protein
VVFVPTPKNGVLAPELLTLVQGVFPICVGNGFKIEGIVEDSDTEACAAAASRGTAVRDSLETGGIEAIRGWPLNVAKYPYSNKLETQKKAALDSVVVKLKRVRLHAPAA